MDVVQQDLPFEPGAWATSPPRRRVVGGAIQQYFPSSGSWQVTSGSSLPSVMFNQAAGGATYTSAGNILNAQ